MKVLIGILMLASMGHVQASQVEIKNFNFSYSAPLGEGTADSFSYQQKIDEAQKVHVEKTGEDFKISLEGVENRELHFKNAPDIVKNAQEIKLASFNLSFQNAATLSFSSAMFHSPDEKMDLKNVNLMCDRILSYPDVMDQVISGCFQKMNLKAGGFSSLGGEGVEHAIAKALDQKHDEILGGIGIKNVDLKVSGGKFQLTADIKAQISGTANANGSMKYEPGLKKITIKISEVKFSFMDVTSQVFDELKKQESQSMKVSKPYIYLTIK